MHISLRNSAQQYFFQMFIKIKYLQLLGHQYLCYSTSLLDNSSDYKDLLYIKAKIYIFITYIQLAQTLLGLIKISVVFFFLTLSGQPFRFNISLVPFSSFLQFLQSDLKSQSGYFFFHARLLDMMIWNPGVIPQFETQSSSDLCRVQQKCCILHFTHPFSMKGTKDHVPFLGKVVGTLY